MEEIKLIKKCQAGNKEAFQELISIYHPYIYKFLIKSSEDEQIAEDLTQETFLKVIKNIDRFDIYGKAKLSTYIITIAKHCYIDYLRKQKRFMRDVTIDENINAEDIYMNVEDKVIDKVYSQEIIDKMASLSDEQQLVIRMKYIEGLTLKEIGEKLNLEPKTIKSRIHNAVVKLRKMLEGDDEIERNR